MTGFIFIVSLTFAIVGCATAPPLQSPNKAVQPGNLTLGAIEITSLGDVPLPRGVVLAGARNEWVNFALQVDAVPAADAAVSGISAEISSFISADGSAHIDPSNCRCYQVLSLPMNTSGAEYVRQTGRAGPIKQMSRALLACKPTEAMPGDFPLPPGASQTLWIDLHVPPDAAPGRYAAQCRLISADNRINASLPVDLTVYDFALPVERHLQMAGTLDLNALEYWYPTRGSALPPNLLNRHDAACGDLVAALDSLENDAQEHRAAVIVPRLCPTVKWPAGQPPDIDWEDFDSLTDPWLTGMAFADKTPLGYWPLPAPPRLADFDPASQQQYWSRGAQHFSQQNWLTRATVFLDHPEDSPPPVLAAHPLLHVITALRDDQISPAAPEQTERLITAAPGPVSEKPGDKPGDKPDGSPRPHWLAANEPVYDEPDMRVWAWLAYLRGADLVLWNTTVPDWADPHTPGDAGATIWFYPGSWFGVTQPVPGIQLAWARRAEQDFEYLRLAEQRNQRPSAQALARLLTKPVELDAGLAPDPVYALLFGTNQPKVWDGALGLVARLIRPQRSGQTVALGVDMAEWRAAAAGAVLMPRSVDWAIPMGSNQAAASIGVDVFNATDSPIGGSADASTLGIESAGRGWQLDSQPQTLPKLKDYRVERIALRSTYDLAQLNGSDAQPIRLAFADAFTRRRSAASVILPVAVSRRRRTALSIDGRLDDWNPMDQIQDGPLVNFIDRPSLRRPSPLGAPTPTQIFTAWADENFYVAFHVTGLDSAQRAAYRNFITYDRGRVWGEDLCEVLIEPIYPDQSIGKALHIVCKPTSLWTESKTTGENWRPVGDSALRYAATLDGGRWQAELAIPWTAILDPGKPIPRFVRFNFAQHQNQTGATASWAGPIDAGRDTRLMGLLDLRDGTR